MFADQLKRLKENGIKEGKKLLWIFAYLWLLLGLFAAHKSIVLNQQNLLYHQGFAVINALVLAKIMFIAEALHVADDLKQKPLIYPIVYKSAVYSLILISFHVLEEVLAGMWHGKPVSQSLSALSAGGLEEILVFGLIMFVVLMPFFALREIGRDVGEDRLFEQFFVRRDRYIPLRS